MSEEFNVTDSGKCIHLAQRYSVMDQIGQGGMGKVFKGFTYRINKLVWVAIKVLDKQQLPTPDSLDRFHREAELLSMVKHSNIVGFHNYFESEKTAYLVMDYAEGQTLDKWVEMFSGDPPAPMILDIILDVLSALIYMKEDHDGMHHRDLKPQNIMVKQEKGKIKATLIDFGNTKIPSEAKGKNDLTMASQIMACTVGYTPPAVYPGVFTEEDDVFAMACTLMYGLLKHNPFQVESYWNSVNLINKREYDLGQWKGTFLGHWIDINLDPDRSKRMTLKKAQRSLQIFKENPDFLGKCSLDKFRMCSSDTALLSLAEQVQADMEKVGTTFEPELDSELDSVAANSLLALDKALATPLPEIKKVSKFRLGLLLSLLALSVAGAGVAYWFGLIP